jgi:hypothetical protein
VRVWFIERVHYEYQAVLLNASETVMWVSNQYTERRKDYETEDFAVRLLAASPLSTIGVMYSCVSSTRILIFQDNIECVDDTGPRKKELENHESDNSSAERRTHNPIL